MRLNMKIRLRRRLRLRRLIEAAFDNFKMFRLRKKMEGSSVEAGQLKKPMNLIQSYLSLSLSLCLFKKKNEKRTYKDEY